MALFGRKKKKKEDSEESKAALLAALKSREEAVDTLAKSREESENAQVVKHLLRQHNEANHFDQWMESLVLNRVRRAGAEGKD